MKITTEHAEKFVENYNKALQEAYGYDGGVDLDPFLVMKALEKVFGENGNVTPKVDYDYIKQKMDESMRKWKETPPTQFPFPGVYAYMAQFPNYEVATDIPIYSTGGSIIFKKDGE